MSPDQRFEASVRRATVARHRSLADAIKAFRTDAGLTWARLGREAGVDPSFLARIEDGDERPSIETYQRLANALGLDLSIRFFANTGPAIKDRHQARMLEAMLKLLDRRWKAHPEVGVVKPDRGWVDVALHDPSAQLIVATELQSEFRRLEQQIRWHAMKAASLPSWRDWADLGLEPQISQLLVVRRTRAASSIAREFGQQLRAAYPASPDDALAALTSSSVPWPGSSWLWMDLQSPEARLLPGR